MRRTFSLIITMIILASFTSKAMGHNSLINDKIKNARKSFAFIKISVLIKPIACSYASQLGSNLSVEKCDISNLEPKYVTSVGSGSVVKHVLDKSYVLTAAHVCSHPGKDTRLVGHKKITVSLTPRVTVRDVSGNEYKSEIFSLDTKNDLCIVKVSGIFGAPLKVASKMPPPPIPIFSYGAPLGINHPGTVLFYSGYTAGPHYEDKFERTTYFYTLVIRGGSSGSAIINKNAEIVGVVHTAIVGLQELAIGASLSSIQNIVKHIPDVEYKKIGPN